MGRGDWATAIRAQQPADQYQRHWTPKGFLTVGFNDDYRSWTASDNAIICFSDKSKAGLIEKLSADYR